MKRELLIGNLFIVLSFTACSEKTTEQESVIVKPEVNKASPPHQGPKISAEPHEAQGNKLISDEQRNAFNANLIADIRKSLEPLEVGGDRLNTFNTAWHTYHHPSFAQTISDAAEIAKVIGTPDDKLVDEIRSSTGFLSRDSELRRAVIARLSLLTGFFGVEDSGVPNLPQIIADALERPTPTMEDLLTLRIVRQALTTVGTRPKLDDADFPAWRELATSPNVACRAVALAGYPVMRTLPEQDALFYRAYVGETDLQLAKLFIEQIVESAAADAPTLLAEFEKVSPAAPDLGSLIERELTALRSRLR